MIMETIDPISDSYSMELLIVLVVERIWGRISSFMDERHKKIDERKNDERLDAIAEKLAEIKGKQDMFSKHLAPKK